MNSIKRDVFVTRKALKAPIPYTRSTNAQPLEFRFCDFQIPENAEARVYVQKPSGKAVYDNAVIDGNTVVVNVTTQMFCELGACYLQIQLVKDEKILVTFLQEVEVLANYTEGDSLKSKNEAGFFQEFQTKIETTIQTANDTIKELEDKAENGDFNGPPGPPGPTGPSGTIENLDSIAIEFTQAEERENIESGESAPVLFGKIKKFLADIKDAAFYSVVNNLFTTKEGVAVLDAYQGKVLSDKIDEIFEKFYPVGCIYMAATPTNPSELFGGTWVSWGAGRVPVGIDTGQAEFNTVEKMGGEKTHALSTGELAIHAHGLNGHTHTIPAHNHKIGSRSVYAITGNGGAAIGWGYTDGDVYKYVTETKAQHNTGSASGNTANAGSGAAHNNLQPYITCYMWKRTA